MKIKNIWLLFVLALLSLINPISAYGVCWGGMMYGNYGTGMIWFGWIFNILIFVALILFIFWLIKQLQNSNRKK